MRRPLQPQDEPSGGAKATGAGGTAVAPAGLPRRTSNPGRDMNPSRIFIERPVATSLLMVAIILVGVIAYRFLPLSALPQVDYPTIRVLTLYPGASPEVMTSSVTAPLERQFGQMPGLNQMTSTSSAGASSIILQFDLKLGLDVAEQQVQAAINAAGNLLPSDLPSPPVYAKVNPADAPVLTLGRHLQVRAAHQGARSGGYEACPEDLPASRRRPGQPRGRPEARRADPRQSDGARRLWAERRRPAGQRSPTPTSTRRRAISTARRAPTPSTPTTR